VPLVNGVGLVGGQFPWTEEATEMERQDSDAALERLADAFAALVPAEAGLTVDRDTRAPSGAVGWHSGRYIRVRLRRPAAGGQASAYYRVAPAGLELMLATSRTGQAGPMSEDGVPDGAWGGVRVETGGEASVARVAVQRLGGAGQ